MDGQRFDDLARLLVGRLPRRRLLTIVGPGGIGKTTVALALAEALIAVLAQHIVQLVKREEIRLTAFDRRTELRHRRAMRAKAVAPMRE